ncbi:hypothetical protein [Spongiactinospora sp. TRM90649]|uniref:hypothetical protein n=1 Tax=Spongiactinospora sp. TRM90649 TaxID=3031114 RepID=UPI0023FA1B94|nr:hypothetical protein [Spongiactinospora sp. TRM90649]MDF5756680.1 hypothetical protein [Spongiactinospora sp. TRM90649]
MSASPLWVALLLIGIALPCFLAFRHARRDETSVPEMVTRGWGHSRTVVTRAVQRVRTGVEAARKGADGAASTPPTPHVSAPAAPRPSAPTPEPVREKTGAAPSAEQPRPSSPLPSVTDAVHGPAATPPAAGAMFGLVTAIADSLTTLSLIRHGRDIRNPVAHLLAYATILAHVSTSMRTVHARMVDARHDPMVLDTFAAMQAALHTASLQGTETAQTAIGRYRGALEDAALGTTHPRLNDE